MQMLNNNFKLFAKFIILIFVIFMAFVFSSCSSALALKSGENLSLIDEENGRTYIDCNLSLRAASISKDVYAKGPKNDRVILYQITGSDPAEWLSEDITTGIPSVFREINAVPEEPTIADFNSTIYLTQTEVVTIQIGTIEDKEVIQGYIDELLNNESAELPLYDNIEYSFTLNFTSEKYPGLYYLVQYYADTSGKCYLYDRGMQKCVISTSEVFEGASKG